MHTSRGRRALVMVAASVGAVASMAWTVDASAGTSQSSSSSSNDACGGSVVPSAESGGFRSNVQPAGVLADGFVDQLRIDPHGRTSGVILRDGTEIVAEGPAADSIARAVHPGDHVRTPYGPSGTLEIEDLNASCFFPVKSAEDMARGGGPSGNGPVIPYARIDDASRLKTLAVSGRVRTMLHAPNGVPTGFLMDNGAQVHIVPSAAGAVAEQVAPGVWVRVEGRGVRAPQGTSLWAMTITRPNNLVLLDMTRGIGAPELNLR